MNSSIPDVKHNHFMGLDVLLTIFLVVAYGPYLIQSPGVRLEHLIVYPSFVMGLVIFFFHAGKVRLPWENVGLILAYGSLCIYMCARSVFDGIFNLAALDAYIGSFAVLFLASLVIATTVSEKGQLLQSVIKAGIYIHAINSIVVIIQYWFDVWPLLQIYNGEFSVLAQDSRVWYRSGNVGRYIGMFNQPFGAGLSYSLILLCWVYLYSKWKVKDVQFYFLGVLLIVGGWSSGSKVFLFGGMPFAFTLFALFTVKGSPYIRKSVGKLFIALMAILAGMTLVVMNSDKGPAASLFKNNYVMTKPLLQVISGGRFGKQDATNVERYFGKVYDQNKIFGLGMGVKHAYDNEALQIFTYGGFVGLALYLAVFAYLLVLAWRQGSSEFHERYLFLFIIMLMCFAAIGAPVMTYNRISVFLWILLPILSMRDKRQAHHASENRI